MDDHNQNFCDLIQLIDIDKLTYIVTAVDRLHDSQARSIAAMLLELRDEGDEQDHALAASSIYDYVRAWLQHRRTKELGTCVNSEGECVAKWATRN